MGQINQHFDDALNRGATPDQLTKTRAAAEDFKTRLAGKTTARAGRGEAAATSEGAGGGEEDDDYITYKPHTRENPSSQPIRVPKPLDRGKVHAAEKHFTHKVEGTGKIKEGPPAIQE
jgi:hypothetical protein